VYSVLCYPNNITIITVSNIGNSANLLNTRIELFLSTNILYSLLIIIISISIIIAVRYSYSPRAPIAFLTI
jgi:hypothetical protein